MRHLVCLTDRREMRFAAGDRETDDHRKWLYGAIRCYFRPQVTCGLHNPAKTSIQ
jgi:hypothetical protein